MFEIQKVKNWPEITKTHKAAFIYCLDQVKDNYFKIQNELQKYHHQKLNYAYSVKTNPHPEVIRFIHNDLELAFDVSSHQELLYLTKLGVNSNQMSLSGPGKTDHCLKWALDHHIESIHIDSISEYEFLAQYVSATKIQPDRLPRLTLRLQSNDPFASKLGLTKSEISQLVQRNELPIKGIHYYLGREEYNPENYRRAMIAVSEVIESAKLGHDDIRVFMGPGLPALLDPLDQSFQEFKETPFAYPTQIEVGRALIGSAGWYTAPILSVKKTNQGRNIIIIDGGLQHLGSPFSKLRGGATGLQAQVIKNGELLCHTIETIEYDIYGSLCLWHDCLITRIELPANLSRGDYLIFNHAGAYGLTAGVTQFIGSELPLELIALEHSNELVNRTVERFKSYHCYF